MYTILKNNTHKLKTSNAHTETRVNFIIYTLSE